MNGFASRKLVGLAVAGALGASLVTGAVAYASTANPGGLSLAGIAGGVGSSLDHGKGGPAFAAILKGLVDKGVLTQAQADAVVAAVQAARPTPPAGAPGFGRPGAFGDVQGAAATYLGLTQQTIFDQIKAGKSLAEIAAATPGKSRDGLVAALTQAANAAIDKAQTDGKITVEQATSAKARVATEVAGVVDGRGGPSFGKGGPGFRPGGPRGLAPNGAPRPSGPPKPSGSPSV